MFPFKFTNNADRIYKNTKSRLVELSLMELHEFAGTGTEQLQFKLRKIRAGKYLERLERPIDTPFDFCYIPKSSRKIIKFANKYHRFYSYFSKNETSHGRI
ncbi:MAG: hypothetical protein PVJ67_06320 [Candidatus Pacearchaeota archaeon]|jgi:hypothetical protein